MSIIANSNFRSDQHQRAISLIYFDHLGELSHIPISPFVKISSLFYNSCDN